MPLLSKKINFKKINKEFNKILDKNKIHQFFNLQLSKCKHCQKCKCCKLYARILAVIMWLEKNIYNKISPEGQYKLFVYYLTLNKTVLKVEFKGNECDLDKFTKQTACDGYDQVMSDLKEFCMKMCSEYKDTLIEQIFKQLCLKIIAARCYLRSLVIIDDIKSNNVCEYMNAAIIKEILFYLDNYEYVNDFLDNPENYDDFLTKMLMNCFFDPPH